MKGKDPRLVNELRKNSRSSLTDIGRKTDIPLSTVFKAVDRLYKEGVIRKNICLLDFVSLGFPIKAGLFIRTEKKDEVKEFLFYQPSLNTLLKLSGDFDFYAEFLFKDMGSYQDCMDELEELKLVKSISIHFITDVKQEEFRIGGD